MHRQESQRIFESTCADGVTLILIVQPSFAFFLISDPTLFFFSFLNFSFFYQHRQVFEITAEMSRSLAEHLDTTHQLICLHSHC